MINLVCIDKESINVIFRSWNKLLKESDAHNSFHFLTQVFCWGNKHFKLQLPDIVCRYSYSDTLIRGEKSYSDVPPEYIYSQSTKHLWTSIARSNSHLFLYLFKTIQKLNIMSHKLPMFVIMLACITINLSCMQHIKSKTNIKYRSLNVLTLISHHEGILKLFLIQMNILSYAVKMEANKESTWWHDATDINI